MLYVLTACQMFYKYVINQNERNDNNAYKYRFKFYCKIGRNYLIHTMTEHIFIIIYNNVLLTLYENKVNNVRSW